MEFDGVAINYDEPVSFGTNIGNIQSGPGRATLGSLVCPTTTSGPDSYWDMPGYQTEAVWRNYPNVFVLTTFKNLLFREVHLLHRHFACSQSRIMEVYDTMTYTVCTDGVWQRHRRQL